MDDIDDLFEELSSLRKKHKQESYQKLSDYVMNMDFASLYSSAIMTMHSPSKNKKISKIKKILDNINDTERT
jgi:hypothetical protein